MGMGQRVGPSTLLATSSATCSEPLMRSSSTCSTTLQILSTRLLSCLRAGLAPKQNLKGRRMPCWPREQWRGSDSLDEFLCYLYLFSNYLSRRWCFSSPAADVSCSRRGLSSVEFLKK